MPELPPDAIVLSDVTVRYGTRAVVDGVSLRVGAGELVALVGGSGSGKTTTLKCINRLVEPNAGEITVHGTDVRAQPAHALRRRIGYCFQGLGLFPHLNVADNIAITPRLCGWPAERIAQRVRELLVLVELSEEHADRMPQQLSGGQQQRVAVARALAAEPDVVLFDEPFGALDPITREALQIALVALRTRLGFSAVFVTHDMLEALALADRIAVMREGKIVQVGTAHELTSRPVDEYVARLVDAPHRAARIATRASERP